MARPTLRRNSIMSHLLAHHDCRPLRFELAAVPLPTASGVSFPTRLVGNARGAPMPDLLDQVRTRRGEARTAQDAILTRAAAEQRDLTPDELAEHGRQVMAEREAADAMDAERDRQLAELRPAAPRRPGSTAAAEPVLTREQSLVDWLAHRGAFEGYGDEPLSLQRYLRGMATGEWDGAEHERALAEATVGAGGALLPPPPGRPL